MHFQDALREWVACIKPRIVVETGVCYGISSREMLKVLAPDASLYSVETVPMMQLYEDFKDDPRWHLCVDTSLNALPTIYNETGPWDVFLHDSDHDVECQTFEYELAWHLVKPGGFILSDDYTWGNPPHRAWQDFLKRHNLKEIETLASCSVTQKPWGAIDTLPVTEAVRFAHRLSHAAAIAYGDKPRYGLE